MNKLSNFRTMHEQSELLLLPNAWDVLSALVLQQAGFKAIGTTSWGMANSMGYQDGEKITFGELFTQVQKIIATVEIPVSVDIESGFSENPDIVVENVLKIAELGAAGINIEDSAKTPAKLKDMDEHCQLLEKIRGALDNNGYDKFFINARTDTYFLLDSPLDETLLRAANYVASGADGIFVPGVNETTDIKRLAQSIKAPLNVMSLPNLTDVSSLNQLGVKRFSIGNALSDATTCFIEQSSHLLLTQQNTACLYDHDTVKTLFR